MNLYSKYVLFLFLRTPIGSTSSFLDSQRLLVSLQYACERGIVDGVDLEIRIELSALDAHYVLYRSVGIIFRLPLERGVGGGTS